MITTENLLKLLSCQIREILEGLHCRAVLRHIYTISQAPRLSMQPNLSLHNGFLSYPSMYVPLWLCVNRWYLVTVEVLYPASVTLCRLDPELEWKGASTLLIWVTVLLGCNLCSSRNRYQCVCIENMHVGLVKLNPLSVSEICVFSVPSYAGLLSLSLSCCNMVFIG